MLTIPTGWEVQHLVVPLSPRPRSVVVINQVSARTSARRDALIELTAQYEKDHPGVRFATSNTRVDAEQWQRLLLDSKFTISPAGRNPETFRTWEALEAG